MQSQSPGSRAAVITIPLSTEDLIGMRFAFSPLCETILSFRVLLKPDEHIVHIPWATRARKALRGTNLRPLAMMYAEGHACPDFLSPPPTVSLASFEHELERFRETPSDLIRDDVEHFVYQVTEVISRRHLGPEQARALDGYLKAPRVSLHRLAETLLRYHDLAIAPYWPRMHALLEGDMLKRAQALALGGAEALFSDLNPDLHYRGGSLELNRPYRSTCTVDDSFLVLEQHPFTLLPSSRFHSIWGRVGKHRPKGGSRG